MITKEICTGGEVVYRISINGSRYQHNPHGMSYKRLDGTGNYTLYGKFHNIVGPYNTGSSLIKYRINGVSIDNSGF